MTLSCIIIAKNAEELIEDCLKSVAFCDEIIVVDAGSIDNTHAIAKKYKAKLIKGEANNFAEQRNIGLKAAKGEWVFYIDTDERVAKKLGEEINRVIGVSSSPPHLDPLLKERKQNVAYKIKRKNFYFGEHEWPHIESLERLFKKSALDGWYGTLHESPRVTGDIGELDGFLLHYTHRDLSSMLQKTIIWSQLEADLRIKNNHPRMTWWRFPRVMLTGFWDSYIKQKGYKAGPAGLVEGIYQAFSMFITYGRLWEMQNKFDVKNSKLKIKS